jgi:hypothetical protein
VQLLLAQHLLDLAEAAGVVAGLDANPLRLALRLLTGTILIGMRAVFSSPFCLTPATLAGAWFRPIDAASCSLMLAPVVRFRCATSASPLAPASAKCRDRVVCVTAMPA